MVEIEGALAGTAYLSPAKHTAFYDYYQKQYAQTMACLQRMLAQAARTRDRQRRSDHAYRVAKRQRLAHLSGAEQVMREVVRIEPRAVAEGVSSYSVVCGNGLRYTGLIWEPVATVPLRGTVILAEQVDALQWIAQYRAQGLQVIQPALARAQHSFRAHPTRKWYTFPDDELLHLFFFLCGGSLAGLEAIELLTVAQALGQSGARQVPIALHLGERHLLTGVIAAALASEGAGLASPLYQLLVLPETVDRLDHQETDARINTIWDFHTEFDALTLLDLADGTDLLFIEPTPTPSAGLSRAWAWFGTQAERLPHNVERRVERLVTPTAATTVATVVKLLTADGASVTQQTEPVAIDPAIIDELYQQSLDGKIVYLEALHESARQARQQRYDLSSLTPDSYRQRVAQSLARVAGPPLATSANCQAQTRLIERRPTYALYEVVLESVAKVEVAGYLLVPPSANPAPAIICQHGLGGRPEALVGIDDRLEGNQWVYDRFAQRLAERGYITFVPFMNWGWPLVDSRDQLVKHAYALGFAPNRFEVAQLHAVVNFLQSRPEVLAERIAFYGLSYGGHASLWLCAHEPRLAAVVTAGHFNEWQTKLLNPELSPPLVKPTAYVTVDEGYDMFNYNVLNEVGHAELATRFAPRPQMIENGLQDAVTPTAWVNREFARTQAVFDWLAASDQLVLEHFNGPHRVWAEGSFAFLERHLRA